MMLQKFSYMDGILSSDSGDPNLFVYVVPAEDEIAYLLDKQGLDRHNLDSAMDPDELGRVETEEDHVFIVLKRPKNYSSSDNFLFKISSAGIFFHPDKVILIVPEKIDFTDISNARKYPDTTGLMLRFLLNATNHFLGHLKVMTMILQSIEERMAENITGAKVDNEKHLHIYSLEKSLIYYANGISSNQIVLEKLRGLSGKLRLTEEYIAFLDDIIIENDQCKKLTETLSKIVGALTRTRETIANNKLNTVMKRLTIITTVFMPLSVITGFFGMSEYSAIAGGVSWWFITYPAFVILLSSIGLLTYRYFKKRGWT